MRNQLYEYKTFDQANIIVEHDSSGKTMFMNGIFIQGDVQNQNKRVYPRSQIEAAVTNIQERIKSSGGVPGELDHPEELTINLDRVSHLIESMWMNNSDGHGKLKIINTPMGNIVKTLTESGVKLGVSSRGSGNVDNNGRVSDFEIVTVDIVAQPSAPNAYPKTIYESLFNMHGGQGVYQAAQDVVCDQRAQRDLARKLSAFIRELGKM
jgi:hypothetical protein